MTPKGTERFKAARILLVEDSAPIRQRLRRLIEETGLAQVMGEAASVAAALFLVHENPFDAVVLDLHLWDGTGFAVLAEVKRVHPDCVVIILAGSSSAEERALCLQLGADHCFDKVTEIERIPEVLTGLHRPRTDPMIPKNIAKEAQP